MVRKGKALVKATTPATTGSTTGNPSLPLNDTYFDTVCQNNARKLVGRGIVCEHPLKFPDAIPDLVRHKIEKQGWNFLYNDTIPVNTTLVREFCANFAQLKQTEMYLRGKMKVFDMAPVLTVIGRDEGTWSDDPDVQGIPPRLKQKKLNLEARLWHQIIVTYLDSVQHDSTLSHSTAIMIWALMEEKKINLPWVLKDAVHKVHAGKRQSLALPCLIMKIAHNNRVPQRPGDEMFHISRAARYIPYGDWDEWGIQLKKRKKRSEAVPLNQLPALVPKPPIPRTWLDLVTPEHEPPSAKRSKDFMDAEGGEDDDQDSEGGVDEVEYAPYRHSTKPKEHPDDSTDTASED
ncbi:hypothetical protein PIB30_089292 [Stylosanthes scabra]|uniref:Putative plant transposon protein domain-containing protein n=1 Tax=Stylosanthes scabra TaxID=79078 RepID=A0ABU6WSA7_9FABA|nr:hypothetical protein [Stylosanthes scabra]